MERLGHKVHGLECKIPTFALSLWLRMVLRVEKSILPQESWRGKSTLARDPKPSFLAGKRERGQKPNRDDISIGGHSTQLFAHGLAWDRI